MNAKIKYDMQAGGMCHLWRSPDDSFKQVFLRLDLNCEQDKYPGVVIVTNEHYEQVFASSVQRLDKELPALLNQIQGIPVVYWWLEQDEKEIQRILSGITRRPVFADRR